MVKIDKDAIMKDYPNLADFTREHGFFQPELHIVEQRKYFRRNSRIWRLHQLLKEKGYLIEDSEETKRIVKK